MKPDSRPLSPHLQIYSFKLHMAMSISHRITGIALVVGTLLLLYWLGSAAAGPQAYATAASLIGSWFGRLLLLGWSFALFYHLCNGIRHLFWDAGKLFEKEEIYKSGIIVLAAAAALTVLAWILGLAL
ncbi:succinate dehydrogenase, cytochrome b556 subunit [Novispirillum itersonii]|uniref:Succinate dehydrogenase cytochrome b556 subunit n=1 Tax=Novispirillum itersonii TaxID=189 RepID=A0A7W9ZG96_NOVIT|nr:succinate dehydrogenase, cytochrome b556 subunit [Novispirillum itersonii]MBB6210952.1 succinate dehydrogenase / fumarate reductase cytochrome b subunit [Novispirillum itersonii]